MDRFSLLAFFTSTLFLLTKSLTISPIISDKANIAVCSGQNTTLNWNCNVSSIISLQWSKNIKDGHIMTWHPGENVTYGFHFNSEKVKHINSTKYNAALLLSNLNTMDSGKYSLNCMYSNGQSSKSNVQLTVLGGDDTCKTDHGISEPILRTINKEIRFSASFSMLGLCCMISLLIQTLSF